ncbi:TetR/AcrR family transcriptional regulator [Noviherbaspirillum cavernae]|uniref:TetR/AcrR family transcriptional regulator n=1 Tax=Noviherbaspirillum cavernae TaxID=2320862 RepID=A0A418X5Z1_9BURK|nr:TetR/AcrR family transcriptional regulator [Noviherbaspirillum cavernae]RJG07888.1 TetR/AcrR family transcriptional regulator [Noviherbaspirillum cavernae]
MAPTRRAKGRPRGPDLAAAAVLLNHARSAFARLGFDAASARAIAKTAGVDPALVAHYYGSKEALWLAVVDQLANQVSAMASSLTLLRSRTDLDARTRVMHALQLLVRESCQEPEWGMFFSRAATEQGERLEVLMQRLVRPYHDAFLPLLTDAIECGAIARQDPEILYALLANAVVMTISYRHVLKDFSTLSEEPELFEAAILHSVLCMLGPDAGALPR